MRPQEWGPSGRIPGAVARTLRTRCGGCGDSLGAEGLGASPLAALALPRPPPRFPCSEVFEASHPLGLPGPPPPPSGLSHPSRLSAAPTPHPPAALRPLRTSAPPALAVCAQRLQTLPWALLDPLGQDSCRPPLGDGPRALKAESTGSFRDWQPGLEVLRILGPSQSQVVAWEGCGHQGPSSSDTPSSSLKLSRGRNYWLSNSSISPVTLGSIRRRPPP